MTPQKTSHKPQPVRELTAARKRIAATERVSQNEKDACSRSSIRAELKRAGIM